MKIILTNMCMIYSNNQILVQNRIKNDWPGINFPGGHVENNEDIDCSVIREIKEETGLTLKEVECVGAINWLDEENDIRHLCILYRSNKFEGQLISSSEGEMFWISLKDVDKYPQSIDFDKVLKKCLIGLEGVLDYEN